MEYILSGYGVLLHLFWNAGLLFYDGAKSDVTWKEALYGWKVVLLVLETVVKVVNK